MLAAGLLLRAQALESPPPSTTVERAGDAVIFRGRIDESAVALFLRQLAEPGVRRLVITSQGGLVLPALDMAEAVHAHGLDVEVPEACLSSCANYIFPAGRRKLLGGPAAVGWHGNMLHVLYLHRTGQGNWTPHQIAAAHTLARREADFFRRIGVDGFVCWFAKLPPYGVEDSYALTPEDMAWFGIRDVTVRVEVPPFAPPGVVLLRVDRGALEPARPVVPLDE